MRVRASNDDGATYGPWSGVGRGTPFSAPAPEGFRAKWPTQTSVTLRWDALLDTTEYILEQKKRSEGNGDWTPVEGYFDHLPSQSRGHQPIAVAAGLDCNTEYDFRLSAKHPYPVYEANDGISPHANTDGKTGPYPQDDQITNLLVTLEPNQASLSWAGPTDGNAAGYRVMRKTWDIDAETGERSNATETTVVQNSSHRDEQFQTYRDRSSGAGRDDKSYAYFVEALNADGEAYGLAHTGILRGGSKSVPEPVRNARLTYDTQSRRSMAWDAPPDPWLTTVYAAREGQMRNSAVTDPWRTTYQVERREFQWLDPAEREWYVPEYLDGSTFWTATMTVGSFGPETGFRSSGSQTYGTLSPDTFTHPTAGNFTVTQLQVLNENDLTFTVTPAPDQADWERWVLTLDGARYPLKATTLTPQPPRAPSNSPV